MASARLVLVEMRYPYRLGVAGLDLAQAGALYTKDRDLLPMPNCRLPSSLTLTR